MEKEKFLFRNSIRALSSFPSSFSFLRVRLLRLDDALFRKRKTSCLSSLYFRHQPNWFHLLSSHKVADVFTREFGSQHKERKSASSLFYRCRYGLTCFLKVSERGESVQQRKEKFLVNNGWIVDYIKRRRSLYSRQHHRLQVIPRPAPPSLPFPLLHLLINIIIIILLIDSPLSFFSSPIPSSLQVLPFSFYLVV